MNQVLEWKAKMRSMCYLCVFFTASMFSSAQSAGLSTVKRTLECRSMQLTATTVVDVSLNLGGVGTYQKITLRNKLNSHVYNLNLTQHKSKSSDLKGIIGIDALAYMWNCFQAKSGLEYVTIFFGCDREDAKSCTTVMSSSDSEFENMYDDSGHLVNTTRGGMTPAQVANLKARGLWQELWKKSVQSNQEPGEDHFIYR